MLEHPELSHGKRLIVVSNRLPIELKMDNEGITASPGSGGLVTALAPVLKNRGGVWIGFPGEISVSEAEASQKLNEVANESGFTFAPVFLTKQEYEEFYLGFSNEVLWPLFHDLQGQCLFNPDYWKAYQNVNKKFAEATAKNIHPDDFIWVHDYHLMLLGDELKKENPASKIGFFLHIPFPPLDIFLKLPWRSQILSSLLEYDLIGFQTQRDRRNFIHCVRTLFPDISISNQGKIHLCKRGDAVIKVGAFPISIDYDDFSRRSSSREIEEGAWLLHEKWANQSIVLSLDRLDYTKGILQRLEAIRCFLRQYPERHKQVTFVQALVPSRIKVTKYADLKKEIDRLVGEINSEFTHENWVPITYMYRSLSQDELLSFYRTSEIALVTPIKDGMNLVAKEFCACDTDLSGVLILSEFAGAAAQLCDGALLVNPYDVEGIANALETALKMPDDERHRRMRGMRKNIKRYNIFWWTKVYLNAAFDLNLDDLPILQEPILNAAIG
jgi:trehalose 6-phosphate synthase